MPCASSNGKVIELCPGLEDQIFDVKVEADESRSSHNQVRFDAPR